MSKIIDYKIAKEYFEKDQHNRLEAKLAKFPLQKGDIIRFNEWDPETDTYTGRYFDRKVNDFHKIHKATKYWSREDLDKFGIYVLDLGENRK